MDLHNNPNLGTDLLAVKVKQLEDKIKQLTQTVGTVEGNIENLSNRVTTANLEAENAEIQNLSVTETLNTNAMVLGESLEVGSATIGEVSATSVTSEEIDSAVSHIGEADGESLDLTGDIHSASIKLDNLVNDVPIATTQYVGYNNNGKLIPVDPTKGVAKWENTARANTIRPVDNANVEIPTDLTLSGLESETMSDTVVLGVDEAGTVVKKDASATLQKKLTAGYNISIDEETNTISCDITTMQMKGSVETVEDLPTTGNVKGDVWNITTTNQNYCWNGSSWFIIGSSVDLTNYYTKTQTDSKFAEKSNTYTKSQTDSAIESLIDDSVTTTGNVWSASKTHTEIEAVDNKNNYSTEETVIGTWIDGKPIYRRVYVFENPVRLQKDGQTNFIVDDYKIKQLINTNGIGRRYNAAENKTSNSMGVFTAPSENKIYLNNSGYDFYIEYLVLEYTKTTD